MKEYSLPNEPDLATWAPDYSEYSESLGRQIIENNKKVLIESGTVIDFKAIPSSIQELLGLTDEELTRVVKGENLTTQDEQEQNQRLLDKFLSAKFLSDFLKPRLIPEVFEQIIRTPAPEYEGRTVIESFALGKHNQVVGGIYKAFDRSSTS